MDQSTFLKQMEEALRAKPNSIAMSHRLNDVEGWDSIGALAVIATVDECYGLTLDAGNLMACQTIGDLAKLVGRAA